MLVVGVVVSPNTIAVAQRLALELLDVYLYSREGGLPVHLHRDAVGPELLACMLVTSGEVEALDQLVKVVAA